MSIQKAKIASIEAFPLVYPTVGRFKFLEGPKGRPAGRAAVLIKMTADTGTVGWGQSVPVPTWSYETLETAYSTITRYLTPALVGQDVFEVEGINAILRKTISPSFSTGQPIAKAGIDLALVDLSGKLLNESAAQRWKRTESVDKVQRSVAADVSRRTSTKEKLAPTDVGGYGGLGDRKSGDRVRLSWTLNPRTLDEVEGQIELASSRGYRDFNVKIAPDPKFDLELCRLVQRLAPNGFLWADANGGYDEAAALEIAPKLADLGVPVFEQPLPANLLGGYRRLTQQGALPIIMDEGIVSSVELEEFIQLGLLNGVAIKPARCGGLTEARKQIEILQNHGLIFLGSGLTDPDVALAGSVALFAAYDLQYPAALNAPQFIQESILKNPFQAINGHLEVPTGPGLGVEVDETRINQLVVRDI